MLRTYKIFFSAMVASIIFLLTSPTFAAESANDLIARIERDTYGMVYEGALLPRLNRLEKDYSGMNLQEDMNGRIEALMSILYDNSITPGIMAKVNAIEWNVGHEVKSGGIEERVEDLEEVILGEEGEGTLIDRVNELARASFGREDIPVDEIQLSADTLVRVALVEGIGTREGQIGDVVHVKVVEDVIVDGDLVFARGLIGTGVIESLSKANDWGRNGKMVINFHKLRCIDGHEIDTYVDYAAMAQMAEKKMILGAALVGMNLDDSWEKDFVFSKNLEVPADTELYIQTKSASSICALKSGRGALTIDKSSNDNLDDEFDDDFFTDYE